EEQRAQVVARRQEPDRQGGGGRAEQRRGRHQADLKRIKPDLEQIGGQDDGGEAVAETARGARSVEIDDIRLPGDAQAFEQRHATLNSHCAIDQSAGVTVKSSKYMWLSALDHRPIRPDTGAGRTCSK